MAKWPISYTKVTNCHLLYLKWLGATLKKWKKYLSICIYIYLSLSLRVTNYIVLYCLDTKPPSHESLRKPCHSNESWLVNGNFIVHGLSGWWYTCPSEKYESQLGWWTSQYIGKIKAMFQTTNQILRITNIWYLGGVWKVMEDFQSQVGHNTKSLSNNLDETNGFIWIHL